MSDYTAFNGATTHQNFTLDSSEKMSQVRTKLTDAGFMKNTDAFLYYNPVTLQKTVLGPLSLEAQVPLSSCTWAPVPEHGYPLPGIQILSNSMTNPSFLGTQPKSGWLHNSPIFGVAAELNGEFSANNAGMFEPVMLQNVVSSNPQAPVSFTQCIIVQKGAIVTLKISSWGATAFGYCVTAAMKVTDADIIPPAGLFHIYHTGNYDHVSQAWISRYANGFKPHGDSIQIKSNAALGIASQYNVEYSTLTFSSWSLPQYTIDGTTHNSSTPIPSGVADAGTAFDPGAPPGGKSSVPSGGTQPGAPAAGPPSTATYGGPMENPYGPKSKPTTRAGGLVGSMEVYFLVFTSAEAANNIIRVLNAPTLGITVGGGS